MTGDPLWNVASEASKPAPGFAERVLGRLPKSSTGRLVPPVPAPGPKLQAILEKDRLLRRRYLRLWGTAAAAALLLSCGTWAFGIWVRSKLPLAEVVAVVGTPQIKPLPWAGFRQVNKGDRIPAGTPLVTREGDLLRLRFPDGSLADLGPGSRLTLAAPRAAFLDRGRIWVSAAKDERPWILETPEGRVRTLGTVFSVTLDSGIPATPGVPGATSQATPDPRSAP